MNIYTYVVDGSIIKVSESRVQITSLATDAVEHVVCTAEQAAQKLSMHDLIFSA